MSKGMEPYVWKRRTDGVNVINLGKTWEKRMWSSRNMLDIAVKQADATGFSYVFRFVVVFAARIIAAIENPNDVCVVSARPYGHRAVLKFAANTGAQAIAGRFTRMYSDRFGHLA